MMLMVSRFVAGYLALVGGRLRWTFCSTRKECPAKKTNGSKGEEQQEGEKQKEGDEQKESGQLLEKIRNNFFISVEATCVPKFAKLAEFSLQATSLPSFSFFLQAEQVISIVNLTILFVKNIKLFQR